MWTPYRCVPVHLSLTHQTANAGSRLADCGHVFCMGCIVDWFDAAHTQFLSSHPQYVPPTRFHQEVLQQPLKCPQAFRLASAYLAQYPVPRYTCPFCRKDVTRSPAEDRKVKAVVSWLSSVQGIDPPETRNPPGTSTNKMFDGYFIF